ncbi:hypothetical protein ACFWNG_03960 [Streptomyces sp. NPDC058391]|uniref:hypothetical protein n=1 Tax=Streptomyces sp. NPDC058391 TaxID=3346476 RepID=UPI00365E61E5
MGQSPTVAQRATIGLRARLREVLVRHIDPDDDTMPTLNGITSGGFTWVPTDDVIDRLVAVVGPTYQGAAVHRALLEEARDALEAAGITGAHGDDWPRLAPAIEQLAVTLRHLRAAIEAIQPHSGPTYGDRGIGYRLGWDDCRTAIRAALNPEETP